MIMDKSPPKISGGGYLTDGDTQYLNASKLKLNKPTMVLYNTPLFLLLSQN